MIKTGIILILLIALAAAAFMTRLGEADFHQYVRQQMTADAGGNFISKLLLEARIRGYIDDCEFHDNYLWTSVTRDGQTVYTGAFNHWFEGAGEQPVKSDA